LPGFEDTLIVGKRADAGWILSWGLLMPDFGFVGAAYEAPSIYQDAQECINFYPEIDPTKAQGERGIIALYPTPGLETVAILPNQQEVRGIRTLSGVRTQVLVICGYFAYVMESDYTPKMIGQLNTSTGQVGLARQRRQCATSLTAAIKICTWFISDPSAATFTGSISNTTLTVTRVKRHHRGRAGFIWRWNCKKHSHHRLGNGNRRDLELTSSATRKRLHRPPSTRHRLQRW
jgi:hypothetical protein